MSRNVHSSKSALEAVAALIAIVSFSAPSLAPPQSITAIRGGTVITMAGPTIQNGTVLIRDGKITEVGLQVSIPVGAQVVDATGKYVMPGIIDAMTYYGIGPLDRNDTSNPLTPENRIIHSYYPFGDFARLKSGLSRDRELLCGGVTAVYIAPGNRQVIGGQGAVVKVSGQRPDPVILREPASVDMTISDASRYDRAAGKSPSTRMAIASLIRKSLIGAQQLDRSAEAKRDLAAEALAKLLRRELPARIEADLVDDIRTSIRLAEEFGFDLVIDSGLGAYRLADVIAEKQIAVVLGPVSHPFTSGDEAAMTRLAPEVNTLISEQNAAMLSKAGVKIAIASFGYQQGFPGGANQGRWMLLQAALSSGFGLPEEEALKALTINPAEILGVSDRVGSLAPGKDGDVIILDGPPLGLQTWVDQVYIDGILAYTRDKGQQR